jgi:hypothetical protein
LGGGPAIEAADQCDITSRPDLANQLCSPWSTKVVPAVPCDEGNPMVAFRGWWCRPDTATVYVTSTSFRYMSQNVFSVPAVPRNANSTGALMINEDSVVAASVPYDPTHNPDLAGKWCDPKSGAVVERCSPCFSYGLTCRAEPGSWNVRKVCIADRNAIVDINQFVKSSDGFTALFLPPHHLASLPPPDQSFVGQPEWLTITEITLGALTFAAGGLVEAFQVGMLDFECMVDAMEDADRLRQRRLRR